jgi:hypothetical protein
MLTGAIPLFDYIMSLCRAVNPLPLPAAFVTMRRVMVQSAPLKKRSDLPSLLFTRIIEGKKKL